MIKKSVLFVCFALVSLSLAGCSTVEGMGKDLQKASETVKSSM
ncbi:MAG: hypothetical protein ACLFP8_08100 [Alphaproteobacteria bacterium]